MRGQFAGPYARFYAVGDLFGERSAALKIKIILHMQDSRRAPT